MQVLMQVCACAQVDVGAPPALHVGLDTRSRRCLHARFRRPAPAPPLSALCALMRACAEARTGLILTHTAAATLHCPAPPHTLILTPAATTALRRRVHAPMSMHEACFRYPAPLPLCAALRGRSAPCVRAGAQVDVGVRATHAGSRLPASVPPPIAPGVRALRWMWARAPPPVVHAGAPHPEPPLPECWGLTPRAAAACTLGVDARGWRCPPRPRAHSCKRARERARACLFLTHPAATLHRPAPPHTHLFQRPPPPPPCDATATATLCCSAPPLCAHASVRAGAQVDASRGHARRPRWVSMPCAGTTPHCPVRAHASVCGFAFDAHRWCRSALPRAATLILTRAAANALRCPAHTPMSKVREDADGGRSNGTEGCEEDTEWAQRGHGDLACGEGALRRAAHARVASKTVCARMHVPSTTARVRMHTA
ncbi:hypothetical protein GGX14DRAFT_562748 [Mycena pura]|uniref:Uncharacterized protein n=1 Tax=Mycena pura TaxID=153505 RepID=A0AAD6VNP0_9AGAR|nr:hypothetical protein GGX14DRAFT_562748 [Mycena pura]